MREAADQQSRAGKKDHRERGFERHQAAEQTPLSPAPGTAASAFLKEIAGRGVGETERGRKSEEDAAEQRDRDGQRENPAVERGLFGAGEDGDGAIGEQQ